jgi:hypothetical protein
LGEAWRAFLRWAQSVHAPLGRWAPLAASGLFAASGFSQSIFLRVLAYGAATALALLIAADLVRSFLENEPARIKNHPIKPAKTLLMTVFEFLIAALLASVYSYFIFLGLGPWTPFIFMLPIFVICSIIAWRNVELWYLQGAEYEEELKEAEETEKLRFARTHKMDNER